MKLRNKKTGEIVIKHLAIKGNNEVAKTYDSLAELNEEWEDVPEEPKEYWFIDTEGEVAFTNSSNLTLWDEMRDERKAIGNYFDTKEEAEQAVEKLKALKRLRDKGFKFEGVVSPLGKCLITYKMDTVSNLDETHSDLGTLFGGLLTIRFEDGEEYTPEVKND